MSIVLVGLNHKTAPVEVRERLAFTDESLAGHLRALVDGEVVREGLIVSTCNRVEVVAASGAGRGEEAASRNVFRVASSLDSMVAGEPQVLGQVRRAYSLAVDAGTAGRVLHRLVHHALRVAKRVRTETGIAASAVSVSYTAVELGRKIFGSLKGTTVLLVGAGEMADLSARHLAGAGAARLLFANRTHDAALALADRYGGHAVAFDSLAERLPEADVVICSTAAGGY